MYGDVMRSMEQLPPVPPAQGRHGGAFTDTLSTPVGSCAGEQDRRQDRGRAVSLCWWCCRSLHPPGAGWAL